jgi:hypothetical protein
MKKLILSVLLLSLSIASFSQTFVKKYTSVITEKDGVMGEWKDASLTVVFNETNTDDIVFYYSDGSVKRFHQVGDVKEDKTNSGDGYQIIMCIEDENGKKVAVQLFDDDKTLRIIVAEGFFVEFHR